MTEFLKHEPFPPLSWDHYSWDGEVVLPSWAGFQVRHGPDLDAHDPSLSDGTARLSIVSVDSDARTLPTAEQAAAFRHLLGNEESVADAVARAILDYCPGEAYGGDDEVLWEVGEVDDLRRLVRLTAVYISTVNRDGVACIGFEFACAWDYEHAAGVMTHCGRVVAVGQGVCSYVEWMARQGLDRIARRDEPGTTAGGEK